MVCKESRMPVPPPPPLPVNELSLHRKGIVRTAPKGTAGSCCCCSSSSSNETLDRLFNEAYRANVAIRTEYGEVIYAHANILGISSPVFDAMLKRFKTQDRRKRQTIVIRGVQPEAVRVFIRFLYSSRYEEEDMKELVLPLLVLSHGYVVPKLKQLCEWWLEHVLMTTENAVDVFQLSLLCDAPRLSLMCHRFILSNLKPICASDGWRDMKESHPVLEKEILESIIHHEAMRKDRIRKIHEREVYIQLYEIMKALVHIYKDGCRTIGPHDKTLKVDQDPCPYLACKGVEALIRHFSGCELRAYGGCNHCKRMWRILELHSRICAIPFPDACKVPLCRDLKQKRRKQTKKEEHRWIILVKRIVRSKSITGAPIFSLGSWDHQH